MELAPRRGLSPARAHPRRSRHGGQRAVDGVRQPRQPVRHGCGLHPQPGDGRGGRLRRLPDQRAGRGRRGGHSQHACRSADMQARVPRDLRRAARDLRTARAALPRHARHRVHDRPGQAVDAADARRQAHGRGGAAHRGGAHERRADQASPADEAVHAGQSRAPRPGAAPAVREDRRRGARYRSRRLTGRGGRHGVLRCRSLCRGGRAGRAGGAGPPGDLARGRARHGRGRGHPDVARRAREPRRGRRPRLGQAGGVRRREPRHRRRLAHDRTTARSCARATSSRSTAAPGGSTSAR